MDRILPLGQESDKEEGRFVQVQVLRQPRVLDHLYPLGQENKDERALGRYALGRTGRSKFR